MTDKKKSIRDDGGPYDKPCFLCWGTLLEEDENGKFSHKNPYQDECKHECKAMWITGNRSEECIKIYQDNAKKWFELHPQPKRRTKRNNAPPARPLGKKKRKSKRAKNNSKLTKKSRYLKKRSKKTTTKRGKH